MKESERYRPTRIAVRLTENEKKYIQKKAQFANKSISEYCRDALIDGVIIKLDTSEIMKVTTELNRIGNNINQIAKAVHMHDDYVSIADFENLRNQIEEIKYLIIENTYHQTYELEARLKKAKRKVADIYVEEDYEEMEFDENIDFEEELKNIEFEYFVDDLPKSKKAEDDLPEDFLKLFEEYGD